MMAEIIAHDGASCSLVTGWISAHLNCRFILALAQIDKMSERTVRRPFDIADLDDYLGPPSGFG